MQCTVVSLNAASQHRMQKLPSLRLLAHRSSTLQELRLPFCNIGVAGVTALAEALSAPALQASAKSDKPVLQPKLTLLDLQVL